MTRAMSGRGGRAGRAASVAAAVAATLVLTGSASATIAAQRKNPAGGSSFRTLFDTVRVFAAASMHAPVRDKLTGTGTRISVKCWTSGPDYKNMPIWYQISAPVAGYVSAFNLATHFSPARGISHCVLPPFSVRYYALEADLRIRTAPSISAGISGHLVHIGSEAIVNCYQIGSPIFCDPIWYHALSPTTGYVAGRFLNTGCDPALGIPRC